MGQQTLAEKQIHEIANGLEESKQMFIWVLFDESEEKKGMSFQTYLHISMLSHLAEFLCRCSD